MVSPIQSIDDDLFTYIISFDKHSDYSLALWSLNYPTLSKEKFRFNPLASLRSVSQVCQSWRRVTLANPLLWADRIVLNDLDQEVDSWRAEVLKRTMNCPLHVSGFNLTRNTPSTEFLFHLLQHHGDRVRNMCLSFSGMKLVRDTRWMMLRGSRSNLNSLYLRLPESTSRPFEIFQTAPGLHTLVLDRIHTQPSVLRLSGIRNLEISEVELEIKALKMLLNATRLEHLSLVHVHLANREPAEESSLLGAIGLHRLRSLRLNLEPDILLMLLFHITPSAQCSTDITIAQLFDFQESRIREILIDYLRTALNNVLFFFLDLERSHSLGISNTIRYSETIPASPGSFSVRVILELREYSRLIHLFTDIICELQPTAVEELALRVPETAYYTGNKTHMRRMFRAIPRVRTIYTTSSNLQSLSRQVIVEPDLFPCLHTLVLDRFAYTKREPENIFSFVQQMRAAGSTVCAIWLLKGIDARTKDVYDQLVSKNSALLNPVFDISLVD